MPLHTSYRPVKLDDIIGNDDTINALRVHLQKKSPNRSLSFFGPAGTGKTTAAICVANELKSYDDWNFKMLNASDFRGIDTVREVREIAGRKPLGSAKTRIWVFEEAHQISRDGQEAMLKLLEDPPKDCWFLLTTTNPEKLKVTLRRRCTEFTLSPLSDKDMTKLLFQVIRKERKRVPNDIIEQICKDSLGSAGMALNILDKVIDLPESDMAASAKRWAERTSNVITLCRKFLETHKSVNKKKGWKEICAILKELDEEDPETIRRQILSYFYKVMLDGDATVYLIMCEFESNYYDVGKAGLVLSAFRAFMTDVTKE